MFGKTTIAGGPNASDMVHARTYGCGHRGRNLGMPPQEQARWASHSRDLHDGADGLPNMTDMLALDVRPLAKQDRDVGRCEMGWPK
jgi:hypothetical protein